MSLFGISWRPSQPFKASFNPSKIGLNDLITGASLFAPGGLAGIGNIGKWSTGNALGNLGVQNGIKGMTAKGGMNTLGLLNGLGAGKNGGGKSPAGGLGDLQSVYQMLAALQAQDLLSQYPQFQAARGKAVSALDPSRIGQEVAANRARTMGAATQAGHSAQAQLGAQGINGAGALLDMVNRGTKSANDYAAQANSAQNIAARRQAQMGILGGNMDAASMLMNLMGAQNSQRQVNASLRQPSAIEQILGIAGQVAPYMDWKKVFK